MLSITRISSITLSMLAVGVLSACGRPQIVPRTAPGVQLATITVTSPSLAEGGTVPVDFTCDGKDLMPELVFSAPPENTKSLVIEVDDPDAQAGTFVHMVLFDVEPDLRRLPGGADTTGAGENARFGLNDFHVARYSGPCPPRGEAHRYRYRVIALDTMLKLAEGTPVGQFEEAIDGHILGEGILTTQFGH